MASHMNQQARVELSRRLARKGYSKSYIRRLLDELEDHFMCICAEPSVADRANADQTFDSKQSPVSVGDRIWNERLGAPADIALIVDEYPELAPIATRAPMQVFVLFPAIVLCIGTACLMLISQFLATEYSAGGRQPAAVTLVSLVQWALPTVAILAVCWLGRRVDVLPWTFASAAILSLGALYENGLYYCAQSDSLAVFQRWEFSLARFGLMFGLWGFCAVLHLILSKQNADIELAGE